jgi:hypothetical protein
MTHLKMNLKWLSDTVEQSLLKAAVAKEQIFHLHCRRLNKRISNSFNTIEAGKL